MPTLNLKRDFYITERNGVFFGDYGCLIGPIDAGKERQEYSFSCEKKGEHLSVFSIPASDSYTPTSSTTDEEWYELGLAAGVYDRMRQGFNEMRPFERVGGNRRKTENRVPGSPIRQVIPASRPKDAGPVLRYRWKKNLLTAPKPYQEGYEAGLKEPKKEVLFPSVSPIKALRGEITSIANGYTEHKKQVREGTTYYDIPSGQVPTTKNIQEAREGRIASTNQIDKRSIAQQIPTRMQNDLSRLQGLFLSRQLHSMDRHFIRKASKMWKVPQSVVKQRIMALFSLERGWRGKCVYADSIIPAAKVYVKPAAVQVHKPEEYVLSGSGTLRRKD